MKITITERVQKEIEIGSIYIKIPILYGNEDIPYDFPLRHGDIWEASFTPEGQIIEWTKEHEEWFVKNNDQTYNKESMIFDFFTKVRDEGRYEIRDIDGQALLVIENDYVPRSLIPGLHGDYVNLHINATGKIMNLELDIKSAFDDAYGHD